MLLLLPLLAPAPLDVLDVHPSLGPFTEIDDAVLAADDGDVIRVAPGTYDSFAIRGKALTVLGGPGVVVEGVVRVQKLAPGQDVSVHGLELRVLPFQHEERIIVGLNQGSVRFEDVEVELVGTNEYQYPIAGARVVSSADVTFVGCVLEPKTGYDTTFERLVGAPGLRCSESSIGLHDCEVTGAGNSGPGFPAYSGIDAFDCELDLFGVRAQGAASGDTYLTFAGNCRGWAGPGGDGVVASESDITTVDCQLIGGNGGTDFCPFTPISYADGQSIALGTNATLIEGPGTAPRIQAVDRVQEGAPFSVAVTSDPGDLVLLLASLEPDRTVVQGIFGALLVDGTSAYRRITLGGSGSFSTTLTAPQLAPFETLALHLQIACLRADPAQGGAVVPVVGSPQVVTVLDSAY